MGIGCAFDELFAHQPKGKANPLICWIEYECRHLILRRKWYCENFNKVISAPRKLSGVIIFDGSNSEIISSRINYNANSENKVFHKDMAEIEEIFRERPVYLVS